MPKRLRGNKMSGNLPHRKRVRSAKGMEYDELNVKNSQSNGGQSKSKRKCKDSSAKSKVSCKIVFTETAEVNRNKGRNNNATTANLSKVTSRSRQKNVDEIQKSDSRRNSKIIDPYFKNVWNKEFGKEVITDSDNLPNNTKVVKLQEKEKKSDGIILDIEVDEDLDYVDDVEDGTLSDTEVEPENEEFSNSNPSNLQSAVQTNRGCASEGLPALPEGIPDEELVKHPRFKNLFELFWKEKMGELDGNKGTVKSSGIVSSGSNQVRMSPVNKSPSDTMIYAPALAKSMLIQNSSSDQDSQMHNRSRAVIPGNETLDGNNIDQIVSDFVDTMRLEHASQGVSGHGVEGNPDLQEKARHQASTIPEGTSDFNRARNKTTAAVVEAEKFKATVAAPKPGRTLNFERSDDLALIADNTFQSGFNSNNQQILDIGTGVSDDDFFHLTCFIEPSLIHKIEKGEFVELEKLLPKDKSGKSGDENRLEWVHRDGGTFLVPAQRDSKITSFCR